MHQEERKIYLEHHPETKGNGYYVRDLQLPCGQLEGLRVPRSRDGGFKSELLPHRRRTIEQTPELLRVLIMAGVSTRKCQLRFNFDPYIRRKLPHWDKEDNYLHLIASNILSFIR